MTPVVGEGRRRRTVGPEVDRDHRPLHSAIRVAMGLVAAGIVLNLIQFAPLDERAPTRYAALHRYETDDLVALGESSNQIMQRYGVYFTLAEIAPGSSVTVSSSVLPDPRGIAGSLHAFGGVTEARIAPLGEHDLLRPAGSTAAGHGMLDPTPFIVAEGAGDPPVLPWAVAADPSRTGREDRQFAFVHWPEAVGDMRGAYLLIETSLLPGTMGQTGAGR